MKIPSPLHFRREEEAFDDPDWIFEINHDGFRALAVIEHGHCRFFSRAKHKLYGFQDLRTALVRAVNAEEAVLDGELAVNGYPHGTMTASLAKSRPAVQYCAFDLLWLNGEDLRSQPLLRRKEQLRLILPLRSAHVLYIDHVRGAGRRLYELACQLKLEGIVAKPADSAYAAGQAGSPWITIKNPAYDRRTGRGEMLKRPA